MADKPTLRLETYFFPHQEVRANPDYDPNGNRSGSQVSLAIKHGRIEGRENAIACELMAQLDKDASENPPYFFRVDAFAIVAVDSGALDSQIEQAAVDAGVRILVGAVREHLASMTGRGPWGPFFWGIVMLKRPPVSDSPPPTPDPGGKTAKPRRAPRRRGP